jgi:hypothetical protein
MMTITRTDPDYGHDLGPASHARPSRIETIGGERISSIRAERIDVRRYSDTTLWDRMHARGQLSDRQHEAALRLGHLWTAAGLNPRVSADYAVVAVEGEALSEGGVRNLSDPEAPTARDLFRRLMREVPPVFAVRLDAMLSEQHPGVLHLTQLQAALDWLCDRWKIHDPV